MARAALQLGVRELAAAAGVSPETIVRLEKGEVVRPRTAAIIRSTLEAARIEFTNGDAPGVRLPSVSMGWIKQIDGKPAVLQAGEFGTGDTVSISVDGEPREIPRTEWEAAPLMRSFAGGHSSTAVPQAGEG